MTRASYFRYAFLPPCSRERDATPNASTFVTAPPAFATASAHSLPDTYTTPWHRWSFLKLYELFKRFKPYTSFYPCIRRAHGRIALLREMPTPPPLSRGALRRILRALAFCLPSHYTRRWRFPIFIFPSIYLY